MSEHLTSSDFDISQANKDVYSNYKAAVAKRDKLVARTFMGGVRRAIAQYTKSSKGYADYYNQAMHAPEVALAHSAEHLKMHDAAIKLDAIHDASASVDLNPPEGGQLPASAINVKQEVSTSDSH